MFLFTTPQAKSPEISAKPDVPHRQSLARASQATGVSFDYLAKTAERESRFDPQAKATTSSATGMFQFLDQTWLDVVRSEGPKLGLTAEASAIAREGNRFTVSDPAMRQRIMALREDPSVSSLMAGAFAARNGQQLAQALGRKPTEGELYIAHFLGPSGARDLIQLHGADPKASAASHFRDAAASNRSVFFDRSGRARSVSEVYANLTAPFSSQAVAGLPERTVAMESAASQMYRAKSGGKVMHGLFRSEGEPVAPSVSSAWGGLSRMSDQTRVAFFPGQVTPTAAPTVMAEATATTAAQAQRATAQAPSGARARSTLDAQPLPAPLDLMRFVKSGRRP